MGLLYCALSDQKMTNHSHVFMLVVLKLTTPSLMDGPTICLCCMCFHCEGVRLIEWLDLMWTGQCLFDIKEISHNLSADFYNMNRTISVKTSLDSLITRFYIQNQIVHCNSPSLEYLQDHCQSKTVVVANRSMMILLKYCMVRISQIKHIVKAMVGNIWKSS